MIQPIKSAVTIWNSIQVSSKNGLLVIFVFLALLIPANTGYARTRIFETLYCVQSAAEARSGVAIKVTDVTSLKQGRPIERELSGGEAHSYQLILAAGQYARLAVDQRGINVAASAFDPDGKKIVEADWVNTEDSESFSFVAETAGAYRLEV